MLPRALGEQFGFRARDQHGGTDGDFQAAEGRGADEMLERLALAAALDKRAERFQFNIREHALEVQIELETRHAQDVREQQLDLQPRRIHAALGEKLSAALDHFEDRHAPSVGGRAGKVSIQCSVFRPQTPDGFVRVLHG